MDLKDVKSDLVLILDTETTGLPQMMGFGKFHDPKLTEKYDGSRLLQLAYQVRDRQGNLIHSYDALRKPNNFEVRATHIHGITEIMAAGGKTLEQIVEDVSPWFSRCSIIAGHNVKFDIAILSSELYRAGLNEMADMIRSRRILCTMAGGKDLYHKNLKLGVLYEMLTGKKMTNAHNAVADVAATTACYFKMLHGIDIA